MTRKTTDIEDYIKRRVIVDANGCWNWQGSLNGGGYGSASVGGRAWSLNRLSLATFKGPIPEGSMALHTCNNRRCCNPDHLYAGSHKDNFRDLLDSGVTPMFKTRPNRNGTKNPCAKLNDDAVRVIRVLGHYTTYEALARHYGVRNPVISNIVNGKAWTHVEP